MDNRKRIGDSLARIRKATNTKEAFAPADAAPLTPEAAAVPPGAPPMDPAMGGMPMDPAMMGAPPMDPAMMGGAMPPMPMDPAAMGMDPATMAGGMPPGAPGIDPSIDPAGAAGPPAAELDPATTEMLKPVIEEILIEHGLIDAPVDPDDRIANVEKRIDDIAKAVGGGVSDKQASADDVAVDDALARLRNAHKTLSQ